MSHAGECEYLEPEAIPDLEAECQRQSRLVFQGRHNLEDLEEVAEVADWSNE
ncbi:antitoxin MazE-like protein [Geomonas propionica]|uniref:DUF3018 family protein n=1 Tax=Geomonas propionica TaxID=2798582 RepID=A0ABS0YKY5_9BACT|nr:antitoxin MazE-like protein [Geomonas propionica]MBJ6798550.1 DUF3018 family protein [Geomonas propionica]